MARGAYKCILHSQLLSRPPRLAAWQGRWRRGVGRRGPRAGRRRQLPAGGARWQPCSLGPAARVRHPFAAGRGL